MRAWHRGAVSDMKRSKVLAAIMSVALILAIGAIAAQTASAAGPPTVGLGTATSFAVLAGAGITNTGPTTINGDVGTYPTTTETGFGSVTLSGSNHAGDAVTQGAKTDLVTAYNTAAGSGPTIPIAGNLGGQTLVPGVYNSASSIGLTGALTLSGGSTDVWIFQAGSTLTTASGSSVVLIGGAQSCNVFWQIGSSATIGTGSAFKGTIIALSSITVTTGATIDGRALARNGAVTLDTNTITRSTCAAAPAPTATPAPSAAPTASPVAAVPTVAPTAAPTGAAVKTLPATSTDEPLSAPVMLAVALAGVGVLLLRRPIRNFVVPIAAYRGSTCADDNRKDVKEGSSR